MPSTFVAALVSAIIGGRTILSAAANTIYYKEKEEPIQFEEMNQQQQRNLHASLDGSDTQFEEHAYGFRTELDDDALGLSSAAATNAGGNVRRIWLITIVVFIFASFVLLVFCKQYGAEMVDSWTRQEDSGVSYARRLYRRNQAKEEAKKECPEKRRQRLIKRLEEEGTVMTVKESDFAGLSTRSNSSDGTLGSDVETGLADATAEEDNGASHSSLSSVDVPPCVNLPPSPESKNAARQVPNCCAICLCPYEVDDKLIWSPNSSCQHCFHDQCLIQWLGKMQDGTPCPCCRQTFVELPHHLDEKTSQRRRLHSDATSRLSESGHSVDPAALDLNRISLR